MNIIQSFLDWAQRSTYGLAILILIFQANIIVPGVTLLIIFSEASFLLVSVTFILSMVLLVMNLALQPPRSIAKLFLANIAYHIVLVTILFVRLSATN